MYSATMCSGCCSVKFALMRASLCVFSLSLLDRQLQSSIEASFGSVCYSVEGEEGGETYLRIISMSATSSCNSAIVRDRSSRVAALVELVAAVEGKDGCPDALRRPSSPLNGLKGVLRTAKESEVRAGRAGVAPRAALEGEADLRMMDQL